jgi:hypothetical protein
MSGYLRGVISRRVNTAIGEFCDIFLQTYFAEKEEELCNSLFNEVILLAGEDSANTTISNEQIKQKLEDIYGPEFFLQLCSVSIAASLFTSRNAGKVSILLLLVIAVSVIMCCCGGGR